MMAIYIDALRYWPHTGKSWCHMASSLEGDAGLAELHSMADKLGMKRAWFQARGNLPHYDLQPSKRALAIKHGAVEVDAVELLHRCSTSPLYRKYP